MQEPMFAPEAESGPSSLPLYRCRWDFCTYLCSSAEDLSFHFVTVHVRNMKKQTILGQKRRRVDDGVWVKIGEPPRLADQLSLPNPTPTSGGDLTTTTHTTDTSIYPPPASLPSLPATFPSALPDFRPPNSDLDDLDPPPATIDFGAFIHSSPTSPVSFSAARSVLPDRIHSRAHEPSSPAPATHASQGQELGSMLPPPPGQRKRWRSTSPPVSQPQSQPPGSSPFVPPTQALPHHPASSLSAPPSSADPTKQPLPFSQTPSESEAHQGDGEDTKEVTSSAPSGGTSSGSGSAPTLSFGALLPKGPGNSDSPQRKRSGTTTDRVGFSWGMK